MTNLGGVLFIYKTITACCDTRYVICARVKRWGKGGGGVDKVNKCGEQNANILLTFACFMYVQ